MKSAPRNTLLALSTTCAALSITAAAQADTRVIYVDASRPASGDGSSWTQAYTDLQIALDSLATISTGELAGSDIRVHIAHGTYRPLQTRPFAFSVGADLSATSSLTLAGSFAGAQSATPDARESRATPTILSADILGNDAPNFTNRDDNCEVVLAPFAFGNHDTARPAPSITLLGLTLQGGSALTIGRQQRGAGFRGLMPSPQTGLAPPHYTFHECTIRDNHTIDAGGGVGFHSAHNGIPPAIRVDVINCSITGNRSEWYGGGIALISSSIAWIERTTIADNIASGSAGGIMLGASTTMDRCLIAGNSASEVNGNGGGIFGVGQGDRPPHYLVSCLIVGNTAALGGGAYFEAADIDHCTIVDNRATYGGGMFATSGSLQLWDSIVARNVASTTGPQIAGGGTSSFFYLSAIEGATQGLHFPFSLFEPTALPAFIPYNADFIDPDGADNDPATWVDNDYHLVPHSSLIDASQVWPGLLRDLDGNERRVEGVLGRGLYMDLGCYESQSTLCPADMTADGGVTIDDLLFFLDHFERGSPRADIATWWSAPLTDDAVTIWDLTFFLDQFERGC